MRDLEDAWFKFIADGGSNEQVLVALRPLYQRRMLTMDHLLVLRHYGRRGIAPDNRRVKEVKAYELWNEAMERIRPAFERLGHVPPQVYKLTIVGGTDVQTAPSC